MSTEYSSSVSSVASVVSSVGSVVSVSSRTNTKNYRIRNNFPNLKRSYADSTFFSKDNFANLKFALRRTKILKY